MLAPTDFDAKVNTILTDIAAVRSAVDAAIALGGIPDSVGNALDSIQAVVTDFKNSVTPPAPVA